MISELSFFLHLKHDPQPFSSAAKQYKASDSCNRISKALKEGFKQYEQASYEQKVEMIINVICQNHMYVFNITYSSMPFLLIILFRAPIS